MVLEVQCLRKCASSKDGTFWAIGHYVDELDEDVWFEPGKIFIKNECTTIWTKKRVDMARSWMPKGPNM